MKFDPRDLLAPFAATVLMALTLQQTLEALHRSGVWRRGDAVARANTPNPYDRLEFELTQRVKPAPAAQIRDPFAFAPVRPAGGGGAPRPRPRLAPPPPPPTPVLTAIVFDNDPRALIRFDGQNYTVRENSLFNEYRVVRITRNEVVLDKGGESLVLSRPVGGP